MDDTSPVKVEGSSPSTGWLDAVYLDRLTVCNEGSGEYSKDWPLGSKQTIDKTQNPLHVRSRSVVTPAMDEPAEITSTLTRSTTLRTRR